MRILIGGIFVLAVATVFAEPVAIGTKSEIQAARGLIEDLVQSGTGADELLTMAADSTKGAERFWLYWNAFILRAKDGKFAEATEIIKSLRANVTGVPDADIVSLIERNARKGLSEVPELEAILKETKVRIAAQKLAVQLKQNIRKNPKDDTMKESLADTMAVCGDWNAALKAYAETKLASASAAKAELARKTSAKVAAFWWDYKPCRALSATTAFKAHAVEIYTELTKDGGLSALEKTLAEKRIAQFSEVASVPGDVNEQAQTVTVSKASDVAELYVADKLLHRWTFNGTRVDDVGGGEIEFHGNPQLDDRQVSIYGGKGMGSNNIFMGQYLIPSDGTPVTIELWATQNKVEDTARIFAFGKCLRHSFDISWTDSTNIGESKIHLEGGCEYKGAALAPFDIGVEYHIGVVFVPKSKKGDLWDLKVYKQDAQTGRTLKKINIPLNKGFSLRGFISDHFHLGLNYQDGRKAAASASYNEVRIWNRALDEKELTQNAIRFHKAGETMKPNK